jgi:hypothetical protein
MSVPLPQGLEIANGFEKARSTELLVFSCLECAQAADCDGQSGSRKLAGECWEGQWRAGGLPVEHSKVDGKSLSRRVPFQRTVAGRKRIRAFEWCAYLNVFAMCGRKVPGAATLQGQGIEALMKALLSMSQLHLE